MDNQKPKTNLEFWFSAFGWTAANWNPKTKTKIGTAVLGFCETPSKSLTETFFRNRTQKSDERRKLKKIKLSGESTTHKQYW